MSATVIQFVPGLKAERPLTISEMEALRQDMLVQSGRKLGEASLVNTAPSEYVAPSDDCA